MRRRKGNVVLFLEKQLGENSWAVFFNISPEFCLLLPFCARIVLNVVNKIIVVLTWNNL